VGSDGAGARRGKRGSGERLGCSTDAHRDMEVCWRVVLEKTKAGSGSRPASRMGRESKRRRPRALAREWGVCVLREQEEKGVTAGLCRAIALMLLR
jgi:hypothetical protein